MYLYCLQHFPGCWSLVLLHCGGKRLIVRFLLKLLPLFLVTLLGVWRSLLLLDLFTRPVLSLSFMVCVAATWGWSYLRQTCSVLSPASSSSLAPSTPASSLCDLSFYWVRNSAWRKGRGKKGEEGITVSSGTFKHIFFKDSGVQSSVWKLQ